MKKTKFSNEDISSLCSELEYLLHAGIGGADALTLLAEDEDRAGHKAVLKEMAGFADEGCELSDAFRKAGVFPAYVCEMLAVGEASGRSDRALGALAASTGARAESDRRMRSALLYPSILLLIMLAVIAVLLIYVLPVFDSVYAQLGGSLTGLAGGLLSFGGVLGKAAPVLVALFCLCVLALALFSSSEGFREKVIDWWQKKRGNRGVSGKMNTARFAQAFSMALSSGMTPEDAVEAAAALLPKSDENKKRCGQCVDALREGQETALCLREAELLPAPACRILEAGIRGGASEQAMEKVAERLTEESEVALEDAMGRVEPAMVLVTSLLVGMILLSVMLPLIHIMSAIG